MTEAVTDIRRVDPRRARTRAALIAAAQQLLADGRTEVSIQEITDLAGVGFGSFYNHFEDKDRLWAAAVAAALSTHGDVVASLTDHLDDPAEVFCVGMRLTGRLQRAYPHLGRVLTNTGIASLLGDRTGIIAQAHRDLGLAIDAGRFDVDLELAIHLTVGAIISLVVMLDNDESLDADALADECTLRVLRAFGLSARDAAKLIALPLPDASHSIELG